MRGGVKGGSGETLRATSTWLMTSGDGGDLDDIIGKGSADGRAGVSSNVPAPGLKRGLVLPIKGKENGTDRSNFFVCSTLA